MFSHPRVEMEMQHSVTQYSPGGLHLKLQYQQKGVCTLPETLQDIQIQLLPVKANRSQQSWPCRFYHEHIASFVVHQQTVSRDCICICKCLKQGGENVNGTLKDFTVPFSLTINERRPRLLSSAFCIVTKNLQPTNYAYAGFPKSCRWKNLGNLFKTPFLIRIWFCNAYQDVLE